MAIENNIKFNNITIIIIMKNIIKDFVNINKKHFKQELNQNIFLMNLLMNFKINRIN